VQKRYSKGLLFQAAYTFSKSLNEGDSQRAVLDVINRRASKGYSADDVPHRFVVSTLYDLPFARTASGWAQRLFGGFSIGGIATFQQGTPFSVGNPAGTVGTEGIVSFADVANPLRLVDARKNERRAFNADAFVPVTLPADLTGVFRRGTAGRNQYRAANGVNNFDLIVSKNTRLWNETSRRSMRSTTRNSPTSIPTSTISCATLRERLMRPAARSANTRPPANRALFNWPRASGSKRCVQTQPSGACWNHPAGSFVSGTPRSSVGWQAFASLTQKLICRICPIRSPLAALGMDYG
jgi:hypothetical protein